MQRKVKKSEKREEKYSIKKENASKRDINATNNERTRNVKYV